jgi:serine/threonine protein kinase
MQSCWLDAWSRIGSSRYQARESVSRVSLRTRLTNVDIADILLTVNLFQHPGEIDVNTLPQPLVKLTDFGLARFIDPQNPMLATRCGSEAYAAPEIVTGSMYDGRKTDAWACGVVLYALATRSLPFDRKVSSLSSSHGHGGANGAGETRRSYLVRIAQGCTPGPNLGRTAVDSRLRACRRSSGDSWCAIPPNGLGSGIYGTRSGWKAKALSCHPRRLLNLDMQAKILSKERLRWMT